MHGQRLAVVAWPRQMQPTASSSRSGLWSSVSWMALPLRHSTARESPTVRSGAGWFNKHISVRPAALSYLSCFTARASSQVLSTAAEVLPEPEPPQLPSAAISVSILRVRLMQMHENTARKAG